MDLLEKFSAVEVKAANRISEADQDFCKRNQAAYETSLTFYTELLRLSTQLKEAQEGLPGNNEKGYLISKHDVSIDEHAVKRHLDNLQECFIRNIVDCLSVTKAALSDQGASRDHGPLYEVLRIRPQVLHAGKAQGHG